MFDESYFFTFKSLTMTLILWLVVGIVAGVYAKRVLPSLRKSSLVFAALVAIVGAMSGGFAGEIIGTASSYFAEVVVALLGAVIVLFFYRQYLADLNTGL